VLHEAAGPDGCEPEAFGVDASALAVLERLYEGAGLYAWRETNKQAQPWAWTVAQRAKKIEAAVRSTRTVMLPKGPNQALEDSTLALFDPEFEQWHFVPCTEMM
jgi:hypothetical protein